MDKNLPGSSVETSDENSQPNKSKRHLVFLVGIAFILFLVGVGGYFLGMKKTSQSNSILNLFVKAQAIGEVALEFTYHPYKYVYKNLVDEVGYKESSIRSSISRLSKRGFLAKKMNNQGEVLLNLTDKGKLNWLRERLRGNDFQNQKDGIYVFVIFDIPETASSVRKLLRENLKEFGFKPWQKSVWATKKNVYGLVRNFFDLAGLSDQVIVLESSKLSKKL